MSANYSTLAQPQAASTPIPVKQAQPITVGLSKEATHMSKRDKQEFLAILESMTVESAGAAGPGIFGHVGYVDVVVGGEHVARAEYLPKLDQYTIDTTQGEFAF